VISWLDARAAAGRWLLRIEDLDPPRIVEGADDMIRRTLDAHGLGWDAEAPLQSSRGEAYEAALAMLAEQDLLFPCTCTRRALRAAGGSYPGTCRGRSLTATGAPSAIRMRVDAKTLAFTDRLRGALELATGGDFVVRRRDGLWAYQLAVVVDDGAAGVTDVVRGLDLLESTPRQRLLQDALGLPPPRYLHHGLVTLANGTKLAKQTGAPAIDDRRASENVAHVLTALGLPAAPGAPPEEQLTAAVSSWPPGPALASDDVLGEAPG
jgi:glutamyl-Q tRNA(Asp) synthetase